MMRVSKNKVKSLFLLILAIGYCHADDMNGANILRHLIASQGLIKNLEFKEEMGPLGWWSVKGKSPDMFRSESPKGDIALRIGDMGYYYSSSRKEIRLQKWPNSFFSSDDILHELIHGNIKLTGKEKIDSSLVYVLEGNLGQRSKYSHFQRGQIKAWINPEKWLILRAEITDEEQGFKETYGVDEIMLIDGKYWFPLEITKTTEFKKYPALGSTESIRKFKDVQINTEIDDEMFDFKLPGKTNISVSELMNSLPRHKSKQRKNSTIR
ncbi:MAG: outer membrane lipoprotein-sorting protein [Thermotogota bacterium]|nr:outer membrane lipoprotein-sorting protein [Thermotogota bacterium]